MKKHRLTIEKNAEGSTLAIISPVNSDDSIDSGYRIAGPKAWGGSTEIASIDISESDLLRYVREYLPPKQD